MDAARARKLADRISQIVAEMLERRIKDPRLGFVTVTEARLTNDLREATVFYTVYGSDEERADTAVALPARPASSGPRWAARSACAIPRRSSSFADEDSAGGNFADRSPAGQTGQDDHLAETPAADGVARDTRGRDSRAHAGPAHDHPGANPLADHPLEPGRVRPAGMAADWARAVRILDGAREVCLACHIRPDGDALGSMLAVAHALRQRDGSSGQRIIASFGDQPFEIPKILRFLPGARPAQPAGFLPGAPAGDGYLRRRQPRPAWPAGG
jgi:hypothetical protein